MFILPLCVRVMDVVFVIIYAIRRESPLNQFRTVVARTTTRCHGSAINLVRELRFVSFSNQGNRKQNDSNTSIPPLSRKAPIICMSTTNNWALSTATRSTLFRIFFVIFAVLPTLIAHELSSKSQTCYAISICHDSWLMENVTNVITFLWAKSFRRDHTNFNRIVI